MFTNVDPTLQPCHANPCCRCKPADCQATLKPVANPKLLKREGQQNNRESSTIHRSCVSDSLSLESKSECEGQLLTTTGLMLILQILVFLALCTANSNVISWRVGGVIIVTSKRPGAIQEPSSVSSISPELPRAPPQRCLTCLDPRLEDSRPSSIRV